MGADFVGSSSKAFICATVDAHTCDLGEVCLRDLPASFGVPQFMNVKFPEKTIAGPERATEIRSIEKSADQALLQDTELGYGWTMAIDTNGSMSMRLVNKPGGLGGFRLSHTAVTVSGRPRIGSRKFEFPMGVSHADVTFADRDRRFNAPRG
ncbi:hypothetical protein [Caballeronia sp. RCC_10]|uniref:hypothetical protein n=1 Tax=Caballeronia sp. RCC_10 TaxID=3239227 RepID=UPI003523588D